MFSESEIFFDNREIYFDRYLQALQELYLEFNLMLNQEQNEYSINLSKDDYNQLNDTFFKQLMKWPTTIGKVQLLKEDLKEFQSIVSKLGDRSYITKRNLPTIIKLFDRNLKVSQNIMHKYQELNEENVEFLRDFRELLNTIISLG